MCLTHTYQCVSTLSVLGLAGSTPEAPKLERDATGAPDWRWKKGVPPLTQKVEMALVQQGVLKASERRMVVYADSGAELTLAGGAQQAPKAFHCIGVLLRYATGSFAKTGSGQKTHQKMLNETAVIVRRLRALERLPQEVHRNHRRHSRSRA
jgi:hypothetical protein